ncbi:hypothetical protein K435DRAFT_878551 [Dendrothele bispora CBS 962.96]|uniref:Uncharacterized protein n=1 Tax=Dendrothele bispora (strain CBS 962.96) TaxID=1314807 RepID=A0A4S8KMY0_DENBC|nr:hypothetical protein K435DRAFT_878551 [Dendrothele bispora CBS 962.96]
MSTVSGKPLSFPALVGLFTILGVLICMTLFVGFSMFYYNADFHRSVDVEKQQLKQTQNYPLQKITPHLARSKPPSAAVTRDGLVDVKGTPFPPPPQRPVSPKSDAIIQTAQALKKNEPSLSSGVPAVGDRMTREEAEAVLVKYRLLKQRDRAIKQRLRDADLF